MVSSVPRLREFRCTCIPLQFFRVFNQNRIILDLVSAEVASQVQSSQDSLVVHGKSLIENTLHA